MRRIGTALLLIGALALGLTLPWLVTMQKEFRDEAAGIQQVDLTADSGLSVLEKIGLLADSESSLLAVGIGRYQTAATLSEASWKVLDLLQNSYGIPLLQTETAAQVLQTAYLISRGEEAFLFWEVTFEDGLGATLRLCLDDETGNLLALAWSGEDESGKMMSADYADWCTATLWMLCDANGLSPVSGSLDPVGMAPAEAEAVEAAEAEEAAQKDGLAVESPANYEVNRVTYAGAYTLTDDAAAAQVTIGIESGYGWLYVNSTHLS